MIVVQDTTRILYLRISDISNIVCYYILLIVKSLGKYKEKPVLPY